MVQDSEIVKALEVGVSCLKNILYLIHPKNPNFENAPCFILPYDKDSQVVRIKEGGVCPPNKWGFQQGIFLEPTQDGYLVSYLEEGYSWDMFQGYPSLNEGVLRFPVPSYQGFSKEPDEIICH
jgi:hypothetical protein